MKLLLDTRALLWAAGQPERLSAAARKLLSNRSHELMFSAASLWEIAIKRTLGREDFRVEPRLLRRGLLDNGYAELPVTSQHAVSIDALPPLHKDPFDRLLLAQATSEGVTFSRRTTNWPGTRGPCARCRRAGVPTPPRAHDAVGQPERVTQDASGRPFREEAPRRLAEYDAAMWDRRLEIRELNAPRPLR